ncbi:FMN-dependent NADH-azoreductase [Naumannella cuiyingiana]|uniref:FMN dependent NADH:quinone oxidoreductase n=1 Tax=Naumannella cuiyingiana TaxID=1347891 RepID=A0A7Z0DAH8_9ACTN|nr:NAD(P)H-dependent oxidoreductase [Naumannella cuiyingiana]NYI71713.1 FMN-dependent NADH-azoreductase [Naumannella cuiyingiana]
MINLLHISASPRGAASRSIALAGEFIAAYRRTRPESAITEWDLWDGTLPDFGPHAAHAKMATLAGEPLTGEQQTAYQRAIDTFQRFDAADRYLFSVPMWNATIPYILKQLIDVISQPGLAFAFDAAEGYRGLLRNKKVVIVYTSAVWAPGRPPAFGTDFQSPYLENWLRWAGIEDIVAIRHPATIPGQDPAAVLRGTRAAIAAAALAL